MDAFKTHGAFSWCELTTSDPQAATAFYSKLFGWSFDPMDMGQGTYHVAKVGEAAIGGVMAPPPGAPAMPPAWSCYVTVDDIDATAKQAAALGGKVLVGPQDIPGVGRFAVMQDPQGAMISAITYKME